MKGIKQLICCTAVLLAGCNTTTPTSNTSPQAAQTVRTVDDIAGSQYAERAQYGDELTLAGQKSTHSRILAAGGFVAGAIGGS